MQKTLKNFTKVGVDFHLYKLHGLELKQGRREKEQDYLVLCYRVSLYQGEYVK